MNKPRPGTRHVFSITVGFALTLGLSTSLQAQAQPTGVAPPVRTGMALSGSVLESGNFGDHLACQSRCKSGARCTGYTYNPAAKATCTLLTGTLTDLPAPGALSCLMPCEAAGLKVVSPLGLRGLPTLRILPPNAPAPAPAPTTAPTTTTPPPPVVPPAVKAKVTMPDQTQFVSNGAYAELLFWSYSAMIQNGVRLTSANPGYANIKPLNAAGFPNGTLNVVVTGSRSEFAGKTIVMTAGSKSTTCPIAQFPATWRCVLTIPVGTIGQQQQVSMTTNTTTMLDSISVE